MNNPLQFPATTIVDRLIPKAQFVKASNTPTAVRTLLAEEFEQIRLLYVLRPDTVNVAEGNEVKEIDVFLFRCKTDYYSVNPSCAISSANNTTRPRLSANPLHHAVAETSDSAVGIGGAQHWQIYLPQFPQTAL